MKIICETQIINRQLPNSKIRSNKATLAIGFHPPGKENTQLFIIHFTQQNKTGFRYKVKNNIINVFTKFIEDGKTTISFQIPEHNLQIKCDPLQLKAFLRSLKLGLDNKYEMNKIGLTSLATTAVSKKIIPITSLNVLKRSHYPVKGFPKTLQSLSITGIQRCRVDSQILFLKSLTVLNLSDNCISSIPKELGSLYLVDLDLSSNVLGNFNSLKAWEWLEGLAIQSTLSNLNLSSNELQHFPYGLVKLTKLLTLKIDNNKIRKIPFAIRRMQKLRFLHLSSNNLESLPQTITLLRLDTLDVWGNKFSPKPDKEIENYREKSKNYEIKKLLEFAGRTIISNRIPYSSEIIPQILVDILDESPLCFCGKICFYEEIIERAIVLDLDNIKNYIFSRNFMIYADCVVCSRKCFQKYLSVVF